MNIFLLIILSIVSSGCTRPSLPENQTQIPTVKDAPISNIAPTAPSPIKSPQQTQTTPPQAQDTATGSTPNDSQTTDSITLTTDQLSYTVGHPITISLQNNSSKSIFYTPEGKKFWQLQKKNGSDWENANQFQLTQEAVGSQCFIAQYGRMYPLELQPTKTLSVSWNQTLCPFESKNAREEHTVIMLEKGTYRLEVYYGDDPSKENPYSSGKTLILTSKPFEVK